ncbi:MAG TPA: hypothetical protein VET45_15270 [Candidatus Binatia bacterium]|nr:hypothetical protein [Candidatus Binatia bacterium]
MRRAFLAASGVVLVTAAAGCTSPEATRARGGGPGADPGNHGAVVRMHDGAEPYYETPRLTETPGASRRSASQAKAAEGGRR